MIKIGITGSIATGKSTIAKMLKILGIPIHDSDHTVKDLLKRKEIIKILIKKWPSIKNKNSIDKNALRSIIFSNKKQRRVLEGILHPLVEKEKVSFEKKNENSKILAFDIPLLYETKQNKKFDYVFLAKCSNKTQKLRALSRVNMNNSIYNKIILNQMSMEHKTRFNPIIINTEHPKVIVFIMILLQLLKIKYKELISNG